MIKLTSSIVAAALIFCLHLPAQSNKGGVAVTSADQAARPLAPDFALTDLAGRKLDLAMHRGHVVLLNFWATWCAPCREEIPEFVSLQRNYRSRGLRIVGISLDDERKPVLDFSEKFKLNYPVGIGDAALAEKYGGILGLPVSFLIGCDGRIDAKYEGRVDIRSVEQKLQKLLKSGACTKEPPL